MINDDAHLAYELIIVYFNISILYRVQVPGNIEFYIKNIFFIL